MNDFLIAVTGQPESASPVTDSVVCVDLLRSSAELPVSAGRDKFIHGTHTHAAEALDYKLYTPPGMVAQRMPMVVMLHACSQSPDDFAAGTGMNEIAREMGFFVLYPQQSPRANPNGCWNWYETNHQRRGSGEPALLASLTRALIAKHAIDPGRVYIAGLSAGGAMAVILASTYPDLFSAAGVHSGLPLGAASSARGAFAVMRTGTSDNGLWARSCQTAPIWVVPIPTIVFHGDQDKTVHPRNGEEVIAAAMGCAIAETGALPLATHEQVEEGVSPQGQHYTRTIHRNEQGNIHAEHWLVHGAGHAWSGGRAPASFTNGKGPDATQEMVRFFFAQSQVEQESLHY